MAISPSSRYTRTTNSKGRAVTQRKPRVSSRYAVVVTREGQTFEELASMHLSDPQLYWRIAELNPQVPYPDEIPAGTRLRIPQG